MAIESFHGRIVVATQQSAILAPGEELFLECPCPAGKVLIGGGANVQSLPIGSAANCTLKSSWPINVPGNERWGAVWTNATTFSHPQVVTFTVFAICVDQPGVMDVRDFGAIPNDDSLAAKAANSAAFTAAQMSMKFAPQNWGWNLFVPPGVFHLSEHLRIFRGLTLFGSGSFGGSVLRLDPGKSVIVEREETAIDLDGISGANCTIRDLQILSADEWN